MVQVTIYRGAGGQNHLSKGRCFQSGVESVMASADISSVNPRSPDFWRLPIRRGGIVCLQ
jgi:hypothetical protein